VIYTGKESKIMMNSQAKIGRKLSHLERDLSKFTGVMFSWQAILCLIAAIVSAFFDTSDENKAKTYLNLTDGPPDYKEKFGFFFGAGNSILQLLDPLHELHSDLAARVCEHREAYSGLLYLLRSRHGARRHPLYAKDIRSE
jgi:hypothetical protein